MASKRTNQYTTQIDGKTYTIQIDTDINLTFGGSFLISSVDYHS